LRRLKEFDPNSIYFLSEDSDSEFKTKNIDSTGNKLQASEFNATCDTKKNLDTFSSVQLKSVGKGNFVSRKIYFYKILIKWLDVFSTLILGISTVIALSENSYFYEENLHIRIAAVKVSRCILFKDYSDYNATYIDSVLNTTDFLSTVDKLRFDSVKVNLVIKEENEVQRVVVLILTIIAGVFLVVSRWYEYVRDYIYREKKEVSFLKTPYFWIMLFEIVLIVPIPYPGVNGYFLFKDMGTPLLIPYSSILTIFSLLRVYFILKLFKHLTRWNDSLSEYIW